MTSSLWENYCLRIYSCTKVSICNLVAPQELQGTNQVTEWEKNARASMHVTISKFSERSYLYGEPSKLAPTFVVKPYTLYQVGETQNAKLRSIPHILQLLGRVLTKGDAKASRATF